MASAKGLETTMRHRVFHKPVHVQIGRIDRDQLVTNTRHAALLLLKNWPNDGGKRRTAMKACLQVIKGQKPPSMARRAFIAAAKDASVLLDA